MLSRSLVEVLRSEGARSLPIGGQIRVKIIFNEAVLTYAQYQLLSGDRK